MKNCLQCAKEFCGKQESSVYCSKQCKLKAWRIRNREKIAAQSRQRYQNSETERAAVGDRVRVWIKNNPEKNKAMKVEYRRRKALAEGRIFHAGRTIPRPYSLLRASTAKLRSLQRRLEIAFADHVPINIREAVTLITKLHYNARCRMKYKKRYLANRHSEIARSLKYKAEHPDVRRAQYQRRRERIPDIDARKALTRGTSLSPNDFPQAVVELQKQLIAAKRALKSL